MGIVNGTTNFILTKMGEQGADYAEVLAEAQALGLAERDPTADVEGYDAAAKAAILAGVAFGYDVVGDDVQREGITGIGAVDVDFADRLGYVVKLLAVVGADGATTGCLGPGPPGAGARLPSAGRRTGCLQRRLHRRRGGRRADALRPGSRRAAHGQRGGGRPDRRRAQPGGRTTAPAPDRQPARPRPRGRPRGRLLREPRRGRPTGRPGRGHHGLRRPRGVDPLHGAGGRRATRPAWSS